VDKFSSSLPERHALVPVSPDVFEAALELDRSPDDEIFPAETGGPGEKRASAAEIDQMVDAFFEAIERTHELVRDETCALLQFNAINFADFNRRKSICILELGHIERTIREHRQIPPAVRNRLVRKLDELGCALEENRDVLKMHLDAMRRVSSLISDMLQNFESDGTYVPPLNAIGR
jgi:hypothetical protein